jgi:hypothetical protein
MAHRSFTDQTGREWQAWDVMPERTDRRVTADRRSSPNSDRRSQSDRREAGNRRRNQRRLVPDRRAVSRQPSRLPRSYADGWLCFECGSEKRRLVPVPNGWDRLPDEELAHLLDSARVARVVTQDS